jgi:hypothetical protein
MLPSVTSKNVKVLPFNARPFLIAMCCSVSRPSAACYGLFYRLPVRKTRVFLLSMSFNIRAAQV